jgi:hypothetical protein
MQVSPRIFNHNLKRTKENKKGKREKGEDVCFLIFFFLNLIAK